MDYSNFVLAFNGFQHGNLWYKNYNFITVEDGIISRFKPVDVILTNVIDDNKAEMVCRELDRLKVKPKKLMYKKNDKYGYWDFEENEFFLFSNQTESKDILQNFLMELYIL